jgi:hypothetical protein
VQQVQIIRMDIGGDLKEVLNSPATGLPRRSSAPHSTSLWRLKEMLAKWIMERLHTLRISGILYRFDMRVACLGQTLWVSNTLLGMEGVGLIDSDSILTIIRMALQMKG